MIRRRCRYIVVSDAGCDPDFQLGDLGSAVRKIWIDLGVAIRFRNIDLVARKLEPTDGVYCAIADICYPEPAAQPGMLVYIKPSYHGTEPVDVRSYAALNPTFPHELTADQWFTEFRWKATACSAAISSIASARAPGRSSKTCSRAVTLAAPPSSRSTFPGSLRKLRLIFGHTLNLRAPLPPPAVQRAVRPLRRAPEPGSPPNVF